MLTLEGVETYYGRIKVLQGISLHVAEGDIVAVLGSNGAGKSTILKAISGFIICDYGFIQYCNRRIENMDPHKIVRMGISQVPEGRHTFDDLTVEENLKTGTTPLRKKTRAKERIEEIYCLFPTLRTRSKWKAKYLSGGERQMVALGRALMAEPRLLLLDEPSLGLSPFMVKEIFKRIRSTNEKGITIVMVEQNVALALAHARMGYVIQNGRVERYGTSEQLLADEEIRSAYLGEGKYVDRKELWEGRIKVKR